MLDTIDMIDMIEANWLVFGAVLLLALVIAWWVWRRARRVERRRAESDDVLTPGAAPAERNTLLVEAPPATSYLATAPIAGIAPDILGGMGELIAVAAADEIGAADEARAQHRDGPDIAPAAGQPDDLTRIKGVGPKLSRMLGDLGISRYDQIAAWTAEDVAKVDPWLGAFQGRIERDSWIEQCRYLAGGDVAGYEARYGKL